MNPDRASRALAWTRQMFPEHARKELQRQFKLTDKEARNVLLGCASDETIFRMAGKLDEGFALFVLGKRPLPALSVTTYLWATESGIFPAHAGLSVLVRDRLGMSAGDDSDFVSYALRNLGWIAITQNGSSIEMRHGEAVEDKAAVLVRDWLCSHRPLRVTINGQADSDHVAAALYLESLAGHALAREAMLSANWQVERRPLDAVKAKPLVAVLQDWHRTDRSPRALLRALSPHMESAALIRVNGDQATRAYIGPNLGVPSEWMGRNVMDGGDPTYNAFVKARALEAARSPEPTFYNLAIQINRKPEKYRSLMIAAQNRDGSYLIGSAVERLAA